MQVSVSTGIYRAIMLDGWMFIGLLLGNVLTLQSRIGLKAGATMELLAAINQSP
jgi:hypothetical protein